MQDSDKQSFNEVIGKVEAWYSANLARDTWWSCMADYELEDVKAALREHMRDQETRRYLPRPVDIAARIDGKVSDTGISADEAWAIALSSVDERNTVVWTDEMAQAFGIAKEVLDCGDEVGARMAFRDAYKRLTAEHKGPPVWKVSLGHDAGKRGEVITAAVNDGRLKREYAQVFLPSLPSAPAERHGFLGCDNPAALALSAITKSLPEEEAHERIKVLKRELSRSVGAEDQRDRVAAIIENLPEDLAERREAINALDHATQRQVRHVLGEMEKTRQARLLRQRLLVEANEHYGGIRIRSSNPKQLVEAHEITS